MNTNLSYQEFIHREDCTKHAPYNPELEFYSHIQNGDVEWVKNALSYPLHKKEGLGKLSKDPVQNMKYHFVITTAMVARYCIDAGMEVAASYNLSDYYIQKADACKTVDAISSLHPVMCLAYTKQMQQLRKKKICSLPIANCLDFIYDNLHQRITVEMLAEHVGLNPNYLSRLFKKEMGSCISDYIRKRKIETAKNMLIYSDYSPAEIAQTLAFPSQSYFSEIFKQCTGLSPVKFRNENYQTFKLTKQTSEE